MFRDILTNKWFLGGIGFLIVLSVACVLWYQHDIADEKKAAADAEQLLRQSEITEKGSDTDSVAEQAADVAPVESNTPTADEPINLTTDGEEKDTLSSKTYANFTEHTQTKDNTEEVRVSLYGFGPYPDLPPEFPENYWDGISKEHELIVRVWMRLMEQGVDVVGGTIQNGLVYPVISGTIYVEWDDVGTERYITRITGDPDTTRRIRDYQDPAAHQLPRLTEKDIPADITVLSYPDGGIDPYQFLNLKKEVLDVSRHPYQ